MADQGTGEPSIKQDLRDWLGAHKLSIGAVLWFLALGIPMTPFGDTNLGYALIAAALFVSIVLINSTIWKFSSGVRYAPTASVHTYSKYEKRIRYSLVGGFLLFCALSMVIVLQLTGGFRSLPLPELSYLNSWYFLHDTATVRINTQPLVGYENRYHLLVVCRWPDYTVAPVDDTKIQKSRFLTIKGEEILLDIPLSAEFLAFRRTGLQFNLLLVPHHILHDDINKMSDVLDRGGVLLAVKSAAGTVKIKP